MTRRTWLCVAGGGFLLGLCALWSISAIAEEPAPTDRARELNELMNEVARLKADLKQLELRIDALRRQPPVQFAPAIVTPQHRDAIPENWTPKEFNGMRYYIVPLGSSDQQQK